MTEIEQLIARAEAERQAAIAEWAKANKSIRELKYTLELSKHDLEMQSHKGEAHD